MKVLIACEFSGAVRDAFRALGHDAWSCDLIESDSEREHHIVGDVLPYIYKPDTGAWKCTRCGLWSQADNCIKCGGETVSCDWDLMVAHPPCTHLAVSGARWFKAKQVEQVAALKFVRDLMFAPVPRIAIENPVSIISSKIRKPDQIVQPWMFGHGETKATCLWLKNLPPLKPTNIVEGREQRIWKMPPGENRWKERSRTFSGIAKAMAEQWG